MIQWPCCAKNGLVVDVGIVEKVNASDVFTIMEVGSTVAVKRFVVIGEQTDQWVCIHLFVIKKESHKNIKHQLPFSYCDRYVL